MHSAQTFPRSLTPARYYENPAAPGKLFLRLPTPSLWAGVRADGALIVADGTPIVGGDALIVADDALIVADDALIVADDALIVGGGGEKNASVSSL